MGISQGFCTSFKLELLDAVHNFSTDTFKLALYNDATATLGPETTAYTNTGEIGGGGYTTGGIALALAAANPAAYGPAGAGVYFQPAVWNGVHFQADGALIYNASKANRAVQVLSFCGTYYQTNGTFTVSFPLTLPPPIYLA